MLAKFFMLTLALMTIVSCQKEHSSIKTQDNEETTLRIEAEKALNNQLKEVESFEKQFDGPIAANNEANRHSSTIVDIAIKVPFFKSLVAAVVKTGLAPTLASSSLNATVFAPTDAAFAKLPAPFNNADNISAITDAGTIDLLKSILLYHVLGSEVRRRDIDNGRSSVVTLKPSGASNDNTLYLSKQHGLVTVNGTSFVLLADIKASNGVIHVINNVLSYPTSNIAEIAIGNPAFSTLVAALVKTNLAGVFTGAGDFTVFAPTNEAFAKLPAPFNSAATINGIQDQAQIDALANILKYHVIASRYFTIDLGFFNSIATLADPPANKIKGIFGFNSGYVKGASNDSYARIDPGNILATNGIVHVINKVLLP
jgi:transforming growth factor-beta-induced protein